MIRTIVYILLFLSAPYLNGQIRDLKKASRTEVRKTFFVSHNKRITTLRTVSNLPRYSGSFGSNTITIQYDGSIFRMDLRPNIMMYVADSFRSDRMYWRVDSNFGPNIVDTLKIILSEWPFIHDYEYLTNVVQNNRVRRIGLYYSGFDTLSSRYKFEKERFKLTSTSDSVLMYLELYDTRSQMLNGMATGSIDSTSSYIISFSPVYIGNGISLKFRYSLGLISESIENRLSVDLPTIIFEIKKRSTIYKVYSYFPDKDSLAFGLPHRTTIFTRRIRFNRADRKSLRNQRLTYNCDFPPCFNNVVIKCHLGSARRKFEGNNIA